MQKQRIVTVNLGIGPTASNTFLIDTEETSTVLVTHPLADGLLMRVPKQSIDTASAVVKDSSERGIDFANSHRSSLDYNTISDLDALGMYFAFKRRLTPNQKQILARICGTIACNIYEDDIKRAMKLISTNQSILDDFNLLWYNNFKDLFTGNQTISSKKQRLAIFNIAGYVLAELKNPATVRN